MKKYSDTLLTSANLPDFVHMIKTPPSVGKLAAEVSTALSASRHQLYGDVMALNLVDLEKEGLAEYKCQVAASLDSSVSSRNKMADFLNETCHSSSINSRMIPPPPHPPPPRTSTAMTSGACHSASTGSNNQKSVSCLSTLTYEVSENNDECGEKSFIRDRLFKVTLVKQRTQEEEDSEGKKALDEKYEDLKTFYSKDGSSRIDLCEDDDPEIAQTFENGSNSNQKHAATTTSRFNLPNSLNDTSVWNFSA